MFPLSRAILLASLTLQSSVIACTPQYSGFIVTGEQANAFSCRPEGGGPFPAVIWSHGRVTDPARFETAQKTVWKHICETLASDGFLAFIPIREFSRGSGRENIPYEMAELSRAVDYVKSLPDVDPSRVALMGHSRGGLLALMTSLERKDLKALVVTAPADIRPFFSRALASIGSLDLAVLLLVEITDEEGSLGAVNALDDALTKQGKDVRTIRYDQGGGHYLFTRRASEFGWYWWGDLRKFLREKLP